MSLAIALSVFPVIFLGELPDKTMFASLILATKGKATAVWLGAAAAFLVHVVIAISIGVALFRILPHRVVDGVVSAMFIVGAILSLLEAKHERAREHREEEIVVAEIRSHRQTAVAAFVVIFLAEWGDLTQILTANLAAKYHAPLSVGVGATLALWAVAAIAVIGGKSLLRWINPQIIHIVTAGALVILGALTAILAFG